MLALLLLWIAAPAPLPLVSRIVVWKARRELVLYVHGRVWRVIPHIQLGAQPVGPKHFAGDRRTPEGHYTIDAENRDSQYHLSLHVSYPNAADRAYAAARGGRPGGAVFLHGQPVDYPPTARDERVPGDWTDGCIALSDTEIDLLWQTVPTGTAIDILP